eukprot:scaffold603_cov404-Prasinococcus_capsulatus_cf.AAC.4
MSRPGRRLGRLTSRWVESRVPAASSPGPVRVQALCHPARHWCYALHRAEGLGRYVDGRCRRF